MGKKKLFLIIILLLLAAGSVYLPSLINADTGTATVTGEIVNVREKPGTSYSIVTQIEKGETYPVIDEKDDWYKIKLPSGKTGWIASWLSSKETKTESVIKGTVNVQDLNVRTEPSTSSNIIGKLNKGESVKIIDENNGWTQISFESETAWVSSEYVDKQTPDIRSNTSNIMILHDNSNIRKKAKQNSSIVGQAQSGEVYEVIGEKNNWYKVKTAEGKSGFIASWIVSSTDRPITFQKKGKGIASKTIVIDAGHGGNDQGAASAKGTLEKDLTIKTAKLLEKKLKKAGAHVVMTRNTDEYVPLYTRTNIASENAADAFISLHFDSIDLPDASGHTTYYYFSYEKRLADTIHHHLGKAVNLKDRGTHFGNYYVLRENTQPSLLLELGYLSNEDEEKVIKSKKYQEQITTAIYNGLTDYFSND